MVKVFDIIISILFWVIAGFCAALLIGYFTGALEIVHNTIGFQNYILHEEYLINVFDKTIFKWSVL